MKVVDLASGMGQTEDTVLKQVIYWEDERKRFERHVKRGDDMYKKLSPIERYKLMVKKVPVIQKIWRMLKAQKLFTAQLLNSKKPRKKVHTIFKIFEGFPARINIMYQTIEMRFLISITVFGFRGESRTYEALFGVEPILQNTYGSDDLASIMSNRSRFYNFVLPELGQTISKKLKISTSPKDQNRLIGSIDLDYDIIPVNLEEKLELIKQKKTETQHLGEENHLFQNIALLVKIQAKSRAFLKRIQYKRQLKQAKIKERNERDFGILVKSTFKCISEVFYRIKVFSKFNSNEEYLNFRIIPLRNPGLAQDPRYLLSHRLKENKLINCHGHQLVDYLIDRIKKEDSRYAFFFDLDINEFKPVEIKDLYSGPIEEEDSEEDDKKDISTFETIKASVLRDVVIDDKISISRCKVKNKLVEFNLYYDKFGVPIKKEISNQNYLKIQIQVDKIKKAEPNLPVAHNKDDLKDIVEEISKCFVIDDNGELLVDSSKIDPSAVVVVKKNVMRFDDRELQENEKSKKRLKELEKILGRNPATLTVLLKTAKIFNKVHFLMIIYKQESIIGEDTLSSLANYEQYNVIYTIELKNLSDSSDPKFTAKFSESEVRSLFGLKEDKEICSFFTINLNMYNGNIILPVKKKMHMNELADYEKKHIVFYYKKALDLIQKYLINRKFLFAFNKYKKEIQRVKDKIIEKQAIFLENNWFHAVVYLSNSKQNFKVSLWNAKTYQEFKLKISKEVSKAYLKYANIFAEVLLKSLFFINDRNDVMALRYNFKAIPEKISKIYAMKQSGTRRLGLPKAPQT